MCIFFFFFKPYKLFIHTLFLLGHTHSATTATCGLGVLTSNAESPEVAQPSVGLNLLQALQVFAEFVV